MAPDKRKHLVAGFLIALFVGMVTQNPLTGLALGVLAGIGKEVYDHLANWVAKREGRLPPHNVELLDALYTIAGSAAGAVVVALVYFAESA